MAEISTAHSNNLEPSLALGFSVSAPPQRMPAAPRAFYSFVQEPGTEV